MNSPTFVCDGLIFEPSLIRNARWISNGAEKVLGWFGGSGFAASMPFFTGKMGIPAVFAFLAVLTESLGRVCKSV
jgi:hypothetical protein